MLAEGWIAFGPVLNVALSPSGDSIFSIGSGDGLIAENTSKYITNFKSPKDEIDQFSSVSERDFANMHDKSVISFTRGFTQDSIIFISEDGIWSLKINGNNFEKENLFGTTEQYKFIDSSDNGYFIVSNDDNKIEAYHQDEGKISEIQIDNEIIGMKISKTGNYFAIYDEENGISIYKTRSINLVQKIQIQSNKSGFSWSFDDNLFVADPENLHQVLILSPETGKQSSISISAHNKFISSVALSHTENLIVTLSIKENKIAFSSYTQSSDKGYEYTLISVGKFNQTGNDDDDATTQEDSSAPTYFDFISDDLFAIGEEFGRVSLWRFSPLAAASTEAGTQETQDLESDTEIQDKGMQLKKKKKSKDLKNISKQKTKDILESESEHSEEEDVIRLSQLGEGEEETDSEEEDTDPMLDKSITEESVPKMKLPSESSDEFSDDYTAAIHKKELEEGRRRANKEKFDQFFKNQIIESDTYSSSSESDSDELISTDSRMTSKQKEEQLRKFTAKQIQKQKIIEEHEEEEDRLSDLINDSKDLNASASETESESTSGTEYTEEGEEAPITFMPGSSFDYDGNRKILCWNNTAVIFLRIINEDDDRTAIDIEFHDKYAHNDIHMDNDRHFILATVNENGFAGASRTVLNYRLNHFDGEDSEFKYSFKRGETIDLIALGDKWVAVYTSRRILHVFASSGLEIVTLSMPDQPITMVGSKNRLFIVYGEKLEYVLLDIYNRQKISSGLVPVQPPLKWAGFDEDSNIYVLGNDMVLQELVHRFGYHWTPMCNIRMLLTNGLNYKDDIAGGDSDSDSEDLGLDSDDEKSRQSHGNDSDFEVEKQDQIQFDSFWCVSISQNRLVGVPLKDRTMPICYPLEETIDIPLAPLTLNRGAQSWLSANYSLANATTKELKEERQAKVDAITLQNFTSAIKQGQYQEAFNFAGTIKNPNARECAIMVARNYEDDLPEDERTGIADAIKDLYDQDKQEEEEESDDVYKFGVKESSSSSVQSSSKESDVEEIRNATESEEEKEKEESQDEMVKHSSESDHDKQNEEDNESDKEKNEEEEEDKQEMASKENENNQKPKEEEEEEEEEIEDDDSIVEE